VRFDQILKELRVLHTEKSKQYGTDVDPLANIRRSKELDVDPARYCLIEAGNCMERAKNLLLGRNKEDYRNVFNDGASWFILARIFWEEAISGQEKAVYVPVEVSKQVYSYPKGWTCTCIPQLGEDGKWHCTCTEGSVIPAKETLGNIWEGNEPGPGGCEHRNVLGGVCQKCGTGIDKPDNPMPSDVE